MAANIEATAGGAKTLSANPVLRLWQSSLGKKYIVALTGFLLFGFVIVHMLGNLQIFLGPDALNSYAKALKSNPVLLWGARLGLLAVALLHIVTTIRLTAENRAARPIRYSSGKPAVAASFASRTLIVSGLILLAFIIFHLAHFTLGLVDASYLAFRDVEGRHDVYTMVLEGFSNPLVSLFYIVAVGLLCLHLSHGVSSMFQSLGLRNKALTGGFDKFAKAVAAILFLGNCAIVIAAWAGLVR